MKIKYDDDDRVIKLIKDDEEILIEDNFPSEPKLSPDNDCFVYIAPSEWETIGKLYLYNINNEEKHTLIDPENDTSIPKSVIWLADNRVAVIMGFGMGTVSVGGNVYSYDLETKKLEPITHYPDYIQITDMQIKETGALVLKGIKYTDEQYSIFEDFIDTVSI